MKANLQTTIAVYATAAGGQSEGSSLINRPGDVTDTPKVRDIARHRLVKTNPDVDAQTDSAAFIGKKYRVQDTHYGHLVSEHDSSSSANTAEDARPYSRVLRAPEKRFQQSNRNKNIKKAAKSNPDVF